MKKLLFLLLAVLSIYLVYLKVNADTIVIPDSAIRLRVIPNSNSVEDQSMKEKIKIYLEDSVYNLLGSTETVDEARNIIKKEIPNVEKNVQSIFDSNNYNMKFKVNFGYNYFPVKEYKGITYDSGYYESLVVSIGEAKGDNWWCVLFPPLCLMENNKTTDTEYKFYVGEILKKIFS